MQQDVVHGLSCAKELRSKVALLFSDIKEMKLVSQDDFNFSFISTGNLEWTAHVDRKNGGEDLRLVSHSNRLIYNFDKSEVNLVVYLGCLLFDFFLNSYLQYHQIHGTCEFLQTIQQLVLDQTSEETLQWLNSSKDTSQLKTIPISYLGTSGLILTK